MTLTRIKNFINSPDHDRINFTFICIFYAQPIFNFKKSISRNELTFFKLDPGQIFKIYGWIKLDPGHAEKNYPLRGTRPLVKLNKYAITSPSFPNVGLLAQRF